MLLAPGVWAVLWKDELLCYTINTSEEDPQWSSVRAFQLMQIIWYEKAECFLKTCKEYQANVNTGMDKQVITMGNITWKVVYLQ